jgi:uncharacterized protein YcfJ
MKRFAVSTLALALTAASGSAFAYQNGYGYGDESRYDNSSRYDVAQVVRVDPIIDRSRPASHQECWIEPTGYSQYNDSRYYDHRYRNNYRSNGGINGGAVLGAIVGGALGNQTGHGDGRKAATIAGIAIGAAIGNQVQKSNNRYGYDPRYSNGYYGQNDYYDQNQGVQRCRIVNDYADEERVEGYNVTYRYAGQIYHTTTAYHPGSTIRVQVDVTPIDRGVASTY